MDVQAREELEREVRSLCDRGDHEGAATRAIRGYGPELLGFLVAMHNDKNAAGEVFAQLGEALWKALPKFEWRSSLRTWAYTLARNLSHRFRKTAKSQARRQVPLSQISVVSRVEAEVRARTLPHLRTEVKDRMAALRGSLPHEEQELLILRVNKGLSWNELAEVLSGVAGAELTREAARLRKRFQLVKEKLRELARREGILDG